MIISRRSFIKSSIAFGGGTLALTAAGRYFWISKDDQYYTFSSHALAYSSGEAGKDGYRARVFLQGSGSWLARNSPVREFPLSYKLFFANSEGKVLWMKDGILPPLTSTTIDIPPMGFGSVKVGFGFPKEQILETHPEVGGFFVQETPFGSDGLHMAETRDHRGLTRICGIYPPNDDESLIIGLANASMSDTNVNLRIADANGSTVIERVIAIPKFGSHRFTAGPKLFDISDGKQTSELPQMAPGSPFIFHLSSSPDSTVMSHAWIVNPKKTAFSTYHGSVEKENLAAHALSQEQIAKFSEDPMHEVCAGKGWWCADIGAAGEVAFANENFNSAILMSNYTGSEIQTYHAVLGFDGNLIAKTDGTVTIPKDGILHLPLDDKRFLWNPNVPRVGMIVSHFGLAGRQSVAYAKVVTNTAAGRFMQHYRPNEHAASRPSWLREIEEETALVTDYWVSGCQIQTDIKNVVAIRSFSKSAISDGELQILNSRGIQSKLKIPVIAPYGAVTVSLDSLNGKVGQEPAAIRLVSSDGFLRQTLMVKVGNRNWTARHGTSRLQEKVLVAKA